MHEEFLLPILVGNLLLLLLLLLPLKLLDPNREFLPNMDPFANGF